MKRSVDDKSLDWQVGIWDGMSGLYETEVDRRFAPVVDSMIERAGLGPDERVLDLGTGTGSLALNAAAAVEPNGIVIGTDISPEMLLVAKRRAEKLELNNLEFREGPAEAIPAGDSSFDVVLASLSLMFVIDRAAAAKEIARVLRPGGRFVASVWAAPEECDIVLFQQTAGSFSPKPPVAGVGPGSLADATSFLEQLSEAGIASHVEREELGFDFDNFESAWKVFAGVTASQLEPRILNEAKSTVFNLMWSGTDGPRHFRNVTQFIVGQA